MIGADASGKVCCLELNRGEKGHSAVRPTLAEVHEEGDRESSVDVGAPPRARIFGRGEEFQRGAAQSVDLGERFIGYLDLKCVRRGHDKTKYAKSLTENDRSSRSGALGMRG
jgi:hypothetical protein